MDENRKYKDKAILEEIKKVIEKRENDWVRTWAFKIKEETAQKEGFDKTNFSGSFYTDEEYPGCPYCGAKLA